jgi:hypothetical protein
MNILKELDRLETGIEVDDLPDLLRYLCEAHAEKLAKQGVNVYDKIPKCMTFLNVRGFLADCKPKGDMFTLKQAATRLGYSESGLRKLVDKRAIEFFQLRPWSPIKFKPEWLDAFLAKHTVEHRSVKHSKPLSYDEF